MMTENDEKKWSILSSSGVVGVKAIYRQLEQQGP
jgi:hypothetical protein